jgi:putative transposase
MARSVRVQYAGAVYHVMCRGDRREEIFRDDADRRMFLETLGEACGRSGFRVHAYVLMPNHYHLLVETPEPNLVDGMRWFQGTYTQRFNSRHRVSGHLFQGRYKAIPVEADDGDYFRTVCDYIHLNPARARMLRGEKARLADFPWSSYPLQTGRGKLPEWLERRRVFAAHGLPGEGPQTRARYRAYLERRARTMRGGDVSEEDEAAWAGVRRGWFIGGEGFQAWVEERMAEAMGGKKRASFSSPGARRHDEDAAEERLRAACRVLEVTVEELAGLRQNDPVKQAAAWWVKRGTVVRDEWICERLSMGSRVNVSRAVRAYRQHKDARRKALAGRMYKCTD